jgi:hypothetical protein
MPDSVFMGTPGANPSGSNVAVPSTGQTNTPAMGGQSNPLVPQYPGGTASPMASGFPAYGVTGSGTGASNPTLQALSQMGLSAGGSQYYGANQKGFKAAGFPNAIAGLMASFLQNGAGFNPQAIQALIAALQPSIASGQANIMEQFGAQGLRDSSSASIGLAGFDAQATLNEGQIISQMYEQSVQDYMQVMLAGKKDPSQQGGTGALIGGLLNGAGSLMEGLSSLGVGAGGSGGGGGGGSTGVSQGDGTVMG